MATSGPPPQKPWRPQLTVPKAPALCTLRRLSGGEGSRRSRSSSANQDSATASESEDSAGGVEQTRSSKPGSRASTPGRRQVDGLSNSCSGLAGRCSPRQTSPAHKEARATSAACRRAQQARLEAQSQRDEQARASKEKLSVFRRPLAAAAGGSRSSPMPVAGGRQARRMVHPPTEWQSRDVSRTSACADYAAGPPSQRPSSSEHSG